MKQIFDNILSDPLNSPQTKANCLFIRNRKEPFADIDIRLENGHAHFTGVFHQLAHFFPLVHHQTHIARNKAGRVVHL